MLDFPIIDTHLHVWDPGSIQYPWLADVPKLDRAFLVDDYDRACGAVQIDKMVFVQCEADPSQYQEESDWVASLAKEDPRISAIIPWAPLELGEGARGPLASLAANPLVRGIRRIIQFEPADDFCLQDDFVLGVRLLAEFDLHFEVCVKGDEQFRNATKLVRRCPDVRFILNHVGKPFIREGILDPWRALLKDFSDLPNTWCKVSGLVNEANTESWVSDDLLPYLDHVVECFGRDRLMYGGDWPVATLATDYPRWVETLAQAIAGTHPEHVRDLFRNNALRFYRL